MEYIFIDTNIFYNNWFLSNANFIFLSNYIENTGAILLTSKIVIEEVQNKYEVDLEKANSVIQGQIRQLNNFYQTKHEFNVCDFKYDFENLLRSKFSNSILFGYSNIDNSILVSRAIKRVAPFKESEKGFRDTLIWLSLLSYLKEEKINDDVVFITQNYSDYFEKESGQFKDELLSDINEYKLECNIKPFLNLQSFINDLSKDEYESANMHERLDEIFVNNEADVEDDIETLINRLSSAELQKLFSLKSKYPYIETLLDFRFDIIDGFENISLQHHKKIDTKRYYVTYDAELRICSFLFGISVYDYNKNKDKIESEFTDIYYVEDDYVYFEKVARPKITFNFIIHLESELTSGVEITKAIFSIKS